MMKVESKKEIADHCQPLAGLYGGRATRQVAGIGGGGVTLTRDTCVTVTSGFPPTTFVCGTYRTVDIAVGL